MERLHSTCSLEEIRRNYVQENWEYKTVASPVGSLTLVASETALLSLMWGQNLVSLKGLKMNKKNPILAATEIQLKEYFAGKRTRFDIPLAPEGTEFQKRVWQQLLKIPYGHHITYGEQARRLNKPNASRAVGAANGKNPIGIIIPCHRVLGANGSLTGFAGGLEIKRQLLAIEGIDVTLKSKCLKV